MKVRLGLVPTVPYRMFVPKGTRSSQYAARKGLVWVEVGRQLLLDSELPEVLVPNSIQPLLDSTRVVKFVPSTVNVKGRVTLAVTSSPVSVVKPAMSSGLCWIHAPSDTVASADAGNRAAAP